MLNNSASNEKFLDFGPRSEIAESKFKTAFGKLPLIFLLACSAFIAVERVAVPQVSTNVDPASYAVISHELLKGQSLYTDIWDHKPPAIFVVYGAAELLFGYSPQTLIILNVFVSIIVLYGLYFAGRAGPGGVIAGLVAAALWVIFSGTFELEGRDPNTEPFLNACVIWAFALFVSGVKGGLTRKNAILIGVLFLLASFFKPIVVAVAVTLVCAYVIVAANRGKALRDAVLIGCIGLAGWIGMFGYFAVTDRFDIFFDSVISYNRFYSGDMGANLTAPFRGAAEFFPDFMNPLAIFAIGGTIFTLLHNRRQAALLVALVASSWVAIALPGRFSVHYFQLWLPPLIIGASWAIGFTAVLKKGRFRLVSYAVGTMLFVFLVLSQVNVYNSVLANKWTPFIPLLNAGNETAGKINSLLESDETFFLWGNTPTLYFLSGRRPATPVLFHMHFAESPVSEYLVNGVKADLERNRPELLVTESGQPPVPDWITKDYEPAPIYQNKDTYSFFVRRGGRIANQVGPSPTAR